MDDSSESLPLVVRFRQPDLQRVAARLARRLRLGKPLRGRLVLHQPSDAERRAIAGLGGEARTAGRSISVDLDTLTALVMRGGEFASLADFVEVVVETPLRRERTARQADREAWKEAWAKGCVQGQDQPALSTWLQQGRVRSWIRKLAAGDRQQCQCLLERMWIVLARLPVAEPLPLAQLAAEACGDSHALDRDAPLGRLLTHALAACAGQPPPRKASEYRALWASQSIVLDELSTTVLVLNLPAVGGTPLGDVLCRLRAAGEPGRLTFRQLRGESPCRFADAGERRIFVCENPSIVAAAATRWGAACLPLMCVEGQPNLAAERLLRLLVAQGFRLHYHGDFDWGGLRIASRLWDRFGFTPWRYTGEDYLHAPPGRKLVGKPVASPWDNRLAVVMANRGTVVHEEAVMSQLVNDLSRAPADMDDRALRTGAIT